MSVTVMRDAFARTELRRFSRASGECSWCGATRRPLFTYLTEGDAGPPARLSNNDRMFCNLDCYLAFYGGWR